MEPKVTAVWLQTRGDRIIVLIEVDEQWYEIISEYCENCDKAISHCAHLKNGLPDKAKPIKFE